MSNDYQDAHDDDRIRETPTNVAAFIQTSSLDDARSSGSGQVENIDLLTDEQIEDIEKLTLRWIFQATLDFGMEAHAIFLNSPDEVKDVAEDVTREVLDRLPGYNVAQRIYGTVDYKRARYIILPNMIVRQALFIDSKAERRIALQRFKCRKLLYKSDRLGAEL